MPDLRVCIDVDDLDRAIAFYTRALGFEVVRRNGGVFAELRGGTCPVDLLGQPAGTPASDACQEPRRYGRHWTPVHLDVIVPDLEAALARALEAGATLERPIVARRWGRMANLADPFGHGLCLLQMEGRGYEEIAPA
jgi:catechol 2,3-dioxygenase-like lactoylglutathione lyase family enzyme